MKRLVVLTLAVLAVPSLGFGQAAAKGTAEQEVSALERAWIDAGKKYDTGWFERYLADTIVSTDRDGVVTGKSQMIADVKTRAVKYETLSYDDLKVQSYGDTAIATGIVVVKGTSKDGKPVDGRRQWTDTWIRRGGQWQCVASHESTIAKK